MKLDHNITPICHRVDYFHQWEKQCQISWCNVIKFCSYTCVATCNLCHILYGPVNNLFFQILVGFWVIIFPFLSPLSHFKFLVPAYTSDNILGWDPEWKVKNGLKIIYCIIYMHSISLPNLQKSEISTAHEVYFTYRFWLRDSFDCELQVFP